MFDFQNFELATARQRVNRAELALASAEEMLNEDRGVGINLALCCRVRSARRRVMDARARLLKIDPTTSH